ncbi:flagellar motor switch protein FliN [Legionella jordanis]|uniref:Flagellar motor switch protein FliN n=1 Tax=Legionella jordanis TaxID=456 RepID=A0A0W0V8N1_9GAMM|nr:flagellar motor switch protein FliN [Legionella jordanis]KTD16507.1 flagellar motor switch protein FliN [Legionella jordanis]RMX03947.1 flagellar motor switch protein FliN [Legionella jordanis]RMX21984.1 flagellar motor switch protein FliN [Legionella jordanis]VEH12032.1 flagellar motor switch protein FliN [Legionella jordanis]HAT8712666.1 flagellar motor switch protein FliN [Legionella jordanis]
MSNQTESAPKAAENQEQNNTSQENDVEKMEVILDIPVAVTVEIGRTKMTIRNLLQLNQGGIVALDRLAGEPLDVLVNGTLVAHGEVVVVNDKFGVRLTDIVSKTERIKRLR